MIKLAKPIDEASQTHPQVSYKILRSPYAVANNAELWVFDGAAWDRKILKKMKERVCMAIRFQ